MPKQIMADAPAPPPLTFGRRSDPLRDVFAGGSQGGDATFRSPAPRCAWGTAAAV